MKLDEIKISESFKTSNPSAYKLNACRRYYEQHRKIDRDIVVNQDGILVDGYIGYLVLRENGVTDVDVLCSMDGDDVRAGNSIYVFGAHRPGGDEYCWKITNRTADVLNLAVGRRAIVKTKFGRKTIQVKRIEQRKDCPVITKVKKVYKCLPS